MRRLALATIAALGGTLGPGDDATAAFTGVEAVAVASVEIDGRDWLVWRLFVTVDNSADSVTSVWGNAANPLLITTSGDQFSQFPDLHSLNTDIEPSAPLFGPFPELEWDTFVTIGTAVLQEPPGPTSLDRFPGFDENALMLDDGSWSRPSEDPLTMAGDGLRILIGQFTIPAGPLPATLSGTVNITGVFDGAPASLVAQTVTPVELEWCCLPFGGCAQACVDSGTPDCVIGDPICDAPCPGDGNRDGIVDNDDLLGVILGWGPSEDCAFTAPCFDFTDDLVINVDDLLVVITQWGMQFPCD
ncbi:MAG: hypothetical protein ACYTGC_06110 [Planctomycetota bacterium]